MYSVQSASEVLTIARSGGGASTLVSGERPSRRGGRTVVFWQRRACRGAFWGFLRALEPRTTRIHRQPRVTRFESWGFPREGSQGGVLRTFGSSVLQDCRVRVPSSFSNVARTARRIRGRAARNDAARVGVRVDPRSPRPALWRRTSAPPPPRPRRTFHVIGPPGRQPPRRDTARCAHRRGVSDRGEQGHRSVEGVHRHRQDLSSRGEHEEAGKYLRRALKEAQEGLGGDDPHVAAARNNLAELYRLQRRWDEAERLYEDAARALERHFGPSHPAAATAVHNPGM